MYRFYQWAALSQNAKIMDERYRVPLRHRRPQTDNFSVFVQKRGGSRLSVGTTKTVDDVDGSDGLGIG
jgi:hypothetical protein